MFADITGIDGANRQGGASPAEAIAKGIKEEAHENCLRPLRQCDEKEQTNHHTRRGKWVDGGNHWALCRWVSQQDTLKDSH